MAAFPQIENWYRMDGEDSFEVIAIDDCDQTIEIQYFDGTLSEIDFETWEELNITSSVAAKDYSGAIDIEMDDYNTDPEQSASNSPWEDRFSCGDL